MELEAVEAASAAINALLRATPRLALAATLRNANTVVLLNFSGGATALNEARKNVGIALSALFQAHSINRRSRRPRQRWRIGLISLAKPDERER
jgi:hypothetical protein